MSTALLASDALFMCEGFGSVPVVHASGTWRGLLDQVDRIEDDNELQHSSAIRTRKVRHYTLRVASARLQDSEGRRVVLDGETLTIDGTDYTIRDGRWEVDGAVTGLLVVK